LRLLEEVGSADDAEVLVKRDLAREVPASPSRRPAGPHVIRAPTGLAAPSRRMVGSRQRCETLVCESSAPARFEAYPGADSLNCGQTRAALDGDRVE
jgi:hypothetical protein